MVTTILLAALAWATPTVVVASDGVHVGAETWGRGQRGVVLVHGDGRTRADWSAWGPRLAAQGLAVIAPDLRGHGGTPLAAPPVDADWAAASRDVAAAVAWLRGRGVKHVSLVGVDAGGNVGLAAASAGGLDDIAWIAPRPSAHGMTARLQLAFWSGPILLVASETDALSARTAELLADAAAGPRHLVTSSGDSRGVALLDADPDLGTALIAWLNGTLLAEAEAARRGGAPATKVEDIEAKGRTLEEGSAGP